MQSLLKGAIQKEHPFKFWIYLPSPSLLEDPPLPLSPFVTFCLFLADCTFSYFLASFMDNQDDICAYNFEHFFPAPNLKCCLLLDCTWTADPLPLSQFFFAWTPTPLNHFGPLCGRLWFVPKQLLVTSWSTSLLIHSYAHPTIVGINHLHWPLAIQIYSL